MKRVIGGRSYHHDQPPSVPPPPQRHADSRKIWSTRSLTIFLACIPLLALLYAQISAPGTPSLHSFEFKIHKRETPVARNTSRGPPRFGRHIMKIGYDEPTGHMSLAVHQPQDSSQSSSSLFYIIMEIGSHHKPFYLDIDTGSSLMWVHCRLKPDLMSPKHGPNGMYNAVNSDNVVLCDDMLCKLADEYHDPGICDAEDPDYCQYDLLYADNLGTKGVIVKDSMRLMIGSSAVDVELAFGCGYFQTGCEYEDGPDNPTQLPSDGILGLSRKQASIPSQLHTKHFIRDIIAHCFLPFHRRRGTHVGILLLGESATTTRGIQWARMVRRNQTTIQSAYEGEMVHVKYGKEIVALYEDEPPQRFVTFDSGTAMVWLTRGLYLALRDKISAEAEKLGHRAIPNTLSGNLAIGGTRCWKVESSLKEVPFRHFKDITFGFTPERQTLGGITCVPFLGFTCSVTKFVMPPSNYLSINGNDADTICLALFADASYTHQTFGAYALKGLIFVVDNEVNRIGWRKSDDCQ